MPGKKILLAVVMLVTSFSQAPAQAGNGYPPFGAWAYGSGFYRAPVAVRSRTVYRARPGYGRYSYGWGGYGNWGFSATTRVRTVYRPVARRTYYYSAPSYYSYYAVARPVYYPRVVYSAWPVYYTPTYYVAPVVVAPTCVTQITGSVAAPYVTSPRIVATSVASTSASSVTTPLTTILANSTRVTSLQPSSIQPAATAGQLVTKVTTPDTNVSSTLGSGTTRGVPTKLLQLVDDMMRAGGYEQAATAYAQLSVRYGPSSLLLGRRYVAQVATQDLDQAEAIVELADLIQVPLGVPAGEISNLIPEEKILERCTELLAKRALSRTNDPTSLRCVALWLEFNGDIARANMFHARVAQLKQSASSSSQIELASLK